MDLIIFWSVVGGIFAAILIATGVILFSRRRGELLPAEEHPELPSVEASLDGQPLTEEPVTSDEEVHGDEVPASGVRLERPEAASSRLTRLRRRLAAANNPFARGLLSILARDRVDDATWDDFEATLIQADLGPGPTMELTENLRRRLSIDGVQDPAQAKAVLREELLRLVDPSLDRSLNLTQPDETIPAVVLVVGVNGTGKTTTVGKLGRVLIAEDKTVLFGAADTFRAAAAEQLATWAERVGVDTIRGAEGADPASVAFNAVAAGIDQGVNVVLIDTAGRLHTKTGLMDELGKVKRVIEKKAPVSEVLLVLDATTGQNGLTQARIFSEVVDVTGIVLTKLDGSAKGGIVIQVQRELGVPVKLIGLGEGVDDLAPFDAEQFVDALLAED